MPTAGAETAHDGEGATAPREAAGPDQLGQVVAGEPTDLVDRLAPRHGLGVDDPRGGVGERADGEVGGTVDRRGARGTGRRLGGGGRRCGVFVALGVLPAGRRSLRGDGARS